MLLFARVATLDGGRGEEQGYFATREAVVAIREGHTMKAERRIADLLENLEAQLARHREREAFFAQQVAALEAQRAEHAGQREKLEAVLATFRQAADTASELVEDTMTKLAAQASPEDLGTARNPRIWRLVGKVIDTKGPSEPFGPRDVCTEVNRRFGNLLRRPLDARQVSAQLRRFERLGRIHRVRPGRPHWQALYTRQPAGAQEA